MMNGSQDNNVPPPLGSLNMDTNQESGSSQGTVNPFLEPKTHLQRMENLSETSSSDHADLEKVKTHLKTCQVAPDLQELIALLVFKLEATLKEKDELVMADNSRGALLMRNGPLHSQSSTAAPSNYETDEEDLEKETWTTQESRKKRKKKNKSRQEGGTKKPPPIKIESQDVKSITELAINASSGEGTFSVKTMSNKLVKVNCDDEDGYRKMVSSLKENKVSYYTYENKQTRPLRVVAKGVHHMWSEKEIFDDLQNKGYNIIGVSKQLSAKDKRPLNMFVLSFAPEEQIDSIYKIDRILYNVVEICALKGSKLVPQCKNCQDFGHTKNHCNKAPRCVKCGKGHLTATCTKQKTVRANCANCNGDHPANYRGCTVAKEAQALRNKQRQATNSARQPASKQSQKTRTQHIPISKGTNPQTQKSWAQVAQAPPPTIQSRPQDMGAMLSLILNEVQSIKLSVSALSTRVDKIENKQPTNSRKQKNK